MKLQCAGCGAPLDITPDLDTFACSFCGTAQRVERKGGIVALKRVEAAIHAVQRGTDRTAAELALVRLTKEIAEAEEKRAQAIAICCQKIAIAKRSRLLATIGSFFITLIGMGILSGLVADKSRALSGLFAILTLIVPFIAPVFVFRKCNVPHGELKRITDLWDEHVGKLKAQLAANRAVLDAVPLAA
jgi:hypothetical protein